MSRRTRGQFLAVIDLIALGALDVAQRIEKLQQIAKCVAHITVSRNVVAQLRDVLPQQIDGVLGLLRWQNGARVQRKSAIARRRN